jgi:hypothetical protein
MGAVTTYWERLDKKPLRFAVLFTAVVGLVLEFTSPAGSVRDHVGLVIVLAALLSAALGLQGFRSANRVSTWSVLATKLRRNRN